MNKSPYGYAPQYQQPYYGGIANNGYFYPAFPNQQYQTPPQAVQTPQAPAMQLYAVNGAEGAKAFLLPPNTSAYLMDSDNPYLYLKEADAQGKCTLKALMLSEIPIEEVSKGKAIDTSNFVTKADIAALESKLTESFRGMAKAAQPADIPAPTQTAQY